jgi:hypothetical protein
MIRAIDFGRSWLGDWGGRLTTAHGLVMIWFVMWLLFGAAGDEQKTLLTDIIQLLFSLGSALFALRASRQKSRDGRTRRLGCETSCSCPLPRASFRAQCLKKWGQACALRFAVLGFRSWSKSLPVLN